MELAKVGIHLSPSLIELCSILLKESKIFAHLYLTLKLTLGLRGFGLAAKGEK